MANISIRNLDDDVRDDLRSLAKSHGHSMESEIRRILEDATRNRRQSSNPFRRLRQRIEEIGGVELELPEKDYDPGLDFTGDEYA